MIAIATLFWQANRYSQSFSSMYTPEWVEKLYRGFARNLTEPFRFVCFTDREYEFCEPIEQMRITSQMPSYADCVEPFRLDVPMILCGLDTVIVGNVDHLARYCLEADAIALPRDPFHKSRACNGVVLAPGGNAHVYTEWSGENDMEWMRKQEHVFIDDAFPGAVVSYKGEVMSAGLRDARIVYFHGRSKPHELAHLDWIRERWA